MKSTQRRSSWAEFLGRMAEHRISPHHTSHIHISPHHTSFTSHHITHHKPKEENTKKKCLGRVLARDGILTTSHILHISPQQTSHIHISPYHTSQAERREHKEEVLGPSSYPGWHSHHITHHTSFTSHHITHHTFTSHHITHRTSFTSHHITHHSFTSHHITHH